MEIIQKNTEKKGIFELFDNNEKIGEMTYVWAGADKIIIDHTFVDVSQKGKNLGKQLVLKAVEFARNQHIKILPLCPFALKVFNEDNTIKDVLF
jgi:uncharacterized protein